MMKSLSVLIPVYNKDCSLQVKRLCRVARSLTNRGVEVEIVVMEDGSTHEAALRSNAEACAADSLCRHIVNKDNVGIARIKNRLVRAAKNEWLLFQDTGLSVSDDDFFGKYVSALEENPEARVVCGGIRNEKPDFCSLRYRYETATASRRSVEARRKDPYASMLLSCILLHRTVAERIPVDERFVTYGYEDVMYGRRLREEHIRVLHIDNPVTDTIDEDNEAYVRKTEQAMRTLYSFREELKDEVRMLQVLERLRRWVPLGAILCFHRLFGGIIRRNLSGDSPRWRWFNVYKLGYYAEIVKENTEAEKKKLF